MATDDKTPHEELTDLIVAAEEKVLSLGQSAGDNGRAYSIVATKLEEARLFAGTVKGESPVDGPVKDNAPDGPVKDNAPDGGTPESAPPSPPVQ